MKKASIGVIIVLFLTLLCTPSWAQKITELDAATSVDAADLAVMVDDVAGTPTTKKITWANVASSLFSLGTYAGTFTTLTATSASSLVLGTQSSAAGSIILHNATNNYHFTILSGVSEASIQWTLPTANPGGNNYLVNASTAGVLGYTDPATFATAANWGGSAASPPALGTGTPAAGTFTTLTAGSASSLTLGTASSAAGSAIFKNATNAYTFTLLSGVSTESFTWTLPTAPAGGNNYLINVDGDGTMDYTDPATFQMADEDLTKWGAITAPTVAAAGDVVVGSDANALTVISKGVNNSLFGVNNSGTLGFHTTFNPVLASAPSTDDTYSGTTITLVAGEALSQWDVVYCKNKAGVHACYKYDANGTDKALFPRFMAVAAISADASGTFLVSGTVRNDGWSHTTNQDEGKTIYADETTAGGLTFTAPSDSGDMVCVLGYVIEENVILFNPTQCIPAP